MMELLPSLKATYNEKLEATLCQLRPPLPTTEDKTESLQPRQPEPGFISRYPIEDPSEEIKREFLQKIRALAVSAPAEREEVS